MYGFDVAISGPLADALPRIRAALAREGFGVLCDIDVQATLKTKLGVDSRPYRILGACNPHYAHRAMEMDPNIGLLLPCNVVVREEQDGRLTVSFIDPQALLAVVEQPEIAAVAEQVRSLLMKVRDSLAEPI